VKCGRIFLKRNAGISRRSRNKRDLRATAAGEFYESPQQPAITRPVLGPSDDQDVTVQKTAKARGAATGRINTPNPGEISSS
jgi:hypothetical protein